MSTAVRIPLSHVVYDIIDFDVGKCISLVCSDFVEAQEIEFVVLSLHYFLLLCLVPPPIRPPQAAALVARVEATAARSRPFNVDHVVAAGAFVQHLRVGGQPNTRPPAGIPMAGNELG